jgi:succinate dehydrogenase/fumarate reductase-like Fe-S protein
MSFRYALCTMRYAFFNNLEVKAMSEKMIQVKVFRFDPSVDKEPYYQSFKVPLVKGMSAMSALDYIYLNLDGTVAYYDHAGCDLGICGRCTGKVNGKPGLFCQTIIHEDTILEPVSKSKVIKDLVVQREG